MSDAAAPAFGDSVGDWPPFPDRPAPWRVWPGASGSVPSRTATATSSRARASGSGVDFDWIVTAEQARSYKPSLANFELAFETIDVPRERILHVAQSLFHDHVPAKHAGDDDRLDRPPRRRRGEGATPPASAAPDMTFPDMRSFADAALV